MFLKSKSLVLIAMAAAFLSTWTTLFAQRSMSLDEFASETGSRQPVVGNSVELYSDAGHFYRDLLEEIHNAKDYILMEYYIFREDSISTAILDAVAERARAGVQAYVILDHYGCAQHMEIKGQRLKMKQPGQDFLKPYLDSGVSVCFFNKGTVLPRDHRKLTLIDGKVAFTGGMNVTDLYLKGLDGVGAFWDMHLKVEGPAVDSFHSGFVRMWNECGDRQMKISIPQPPEPCGNVPLIVLETQGKGIRPNPEELFITLLGSAQDSIKFITGYFCPGKAIMDSIKAAAARGVNVDILTGETTDMPEAFDKLLMSRLSLLSNVDNITLHVQPGGFHHEKVISIDGHMLFVGSHNLDQLSIKANHELGVLMDSPALAREFDSYFEGQAMAY